MKRPRSFDAGSGVACGVSKLRRMSWSRWSDRSQTANGAVLFNDGDLTCADGTFRWFSARVTVYRARRGCRIYIKDSGIVRARRRMFTGIRVRYDDQTFRSTTAQGARC